MDQRDLAEAELEQFRQQWKEEVQARTQQSQHPQNRSPAVTRHSPRSHVTQKAISKQPQANLPLVHNDDVAEQSYLHIEEKELGRKTGDSSHVTSIFSQPSEPRTALEYYEKAAESEGQGRLGESLSHYRTAFKLDSQVQEKYKNKHFPASKSTRSNPPSKIMVSTTITTTAATAQPVLDLITSFANISIEGELPLTEISPAPPCPIAHIPEEVLVDILLSVAITDLSSLVRLSQVSKRLAYLISSEDGLWRRVTQHLDFGFPSMLYNFTCKIEWDSILDSIETIEDSDIETPPVLSRMEVPLPLSPKYPTYRQMFKTRPRIRFNGCYISTVNYTRPGAVGSNSLTWNHNILIVTYYRYLRFFRDGSLISLLTTSEPSNVVPYLQKEYIRYQSQGSSHLPQAVMKDALKGRWHLSGDPYGIKARSTSVAETDAEQLEPDNEGDIHIETEGVVAKYKYAMQLRFASAGTGTRNNKLNWVGYWCQNKLTDDVGEFGLKNDRPYFWSRVKSWY